MSSLFLLPLFIFLLLITLNSNLKGGILYGGRSRVISTIMNNDRQSNRWKGKWLKKRAMFLLTLLLVIATTVALFVFFLHSPEKIKEFENYGYLGGFLISLISTATVILPTPGLLLLVALGAAFNPILVGLVGAVGGTMGEMTGYILGYSGRGLVQNNRIINKIYVKADRWMRRRGFVTVFLFSVVPFLPIDIVGMLAGALHFPVWKFLLACFLGKSLLYIIMIQATSWGWDVLLRYIG